MDGIRVQCRLPRVSGLPADDVVNVFHFRGDSITDDPESTAGDAFSRLETFYLAIDDLFAETLSGPVNMKAYDLKAPLNSGPIAEDSFNIVRNTISTPLPAELALRTTFVADGPSSVPVEYRRGGVYLGPWHLGMLSTTEAGVPDVRVAADKRTQVGNALEALAMAPPSLTRLAVYSKTWHKGRGPTSGGRPGGPGPRPALDPHDLEDSLFVVDRIRIDDAWDIQRRRGALATGRAEFVVS